MTNKPPEIMTIGGTAEYLRISLSSLCKLAQEGRIPYQKVDRRSQASPGITKEQGMHIRPAQPADHENLAGLIASFRAELALLQHASRPQDLDAARAEAAEYQQEGFPTYVAEDGTAGLVGYLVCRVAGDVVWAESLYVLPGYRCQGIASALYTEAEKLAQARGGEASYNWVHPNNDPII